MGPFGHFFIALLLLQQSDDVIDQGLKALDSDQPALAEELFRAVGRFYHSVGV